MEKIVLVTGGSSGIGLWTARWLKKAGYVVYEMSRRDTEHPEGICHLSGDVADEKAVSLGVQKIVEKHQRLDILICCAGFGISGATEFTDHQDAKRLLEVNLFGTANAIQAVLPIMRAQRSGRIVCISSLAGVFAIPFQAWYSLSKAAVSSYASALRKEVHPFGIQVTTVFPGDIQTGFTAAREKNPLGDDVYHGRIARSIAGMEKSEINGMSAENLGQYIAKIATKKRVKPQYSHGFWYRCSMLLVRILPASSVDFIVRKMYAD